MKDIKSCRNCELYLNNSITAGNGNKHADIMFIIDNPNYYDVRDERILSGDLGKTFDKLLEMVNLHREDVYVTGLIKCRPTGGRIKQTNIEACKTNLGDEIRTIKPKIIVTMGTKAFQRFFKTKEPLGKYVNVARKMDYGYMMPMYNLQYILRDVNYHGLALYSFVNLYKLYRLKVNPHIRNIEDKLSNPARKMLNL